MAYVTGPLWLDVLESVDPGVNHQSNPCSRRCGKDAKAGKLLFSLFLFHRDVGLGCEYFPQARIRAYDLFSLWAEYMLTACCISETFSSRVYSTVLHGICVSPWVHVRSPTHNIDDLFYHPAN